jgi:hypothetical protein
MNILRLSVVLLLMVAAPRAKAQTADEIIGKYIDALGGKDKLLSIRSTYMEGVAVMKNGMEVESKIWRVKDKLYRQEISFGSMGSAVTIVTPTKGWNSNPRTGGAFTAMSDEQLQKNQPQMDPAGALMDYAAKGSKVELLGQDTVGGKTCYKLKLTLASGNFITYYIDTQTYYVLRQGFRRDALSGGGGAGRAPADPNAEVHLDFSDYQKTPEGYVFPFTIVAGGMGAKTSVEKLEVNTTVDVEKLGKP